MVTWSVVRITDLSVIVRDLPYSWSEKWQSVFSSVKMFFPQNTLLKEEDMTAIKKIEQKCLILLQLVDRVRNVSEDCRHHGIYWSQFYEYKRAFQERGFDGLVEISLVI